MYNVKNVIFQRTFFVLFFSIFSVFSQKQLESALLPTWNAMYDMPKGVSIPFQQPIDASAMPDYFTIVTEPMDLSTIKTKLATGQYLEPWQYIDDVWLMFNNAWRYNKKDSFVYDCCSQVKRSTRLFC